VNWLGDYSRKQVKGGGKAERHTPCAAATVLEIPGPPCLNIIIISLRLAHDYYNDPRL
jgi:hypothetical protein